MSDLGQHFQEIRTATERIAEPLSPEDCVVQSMTDASPIRWHLAHTTWFFETFILKECKGFQPFDTNFEYLFNSYYNAVGEQYPRPKRGLLSRPPHQTIVDYRRFVDEQIVSRMEAGDFTTEQSTLILLGLHHEQQHQELMLTDLKHLLFCNPLYSRYRDEPLGDTDQVELQWSRIPEGVYESGFSGNGFCFDNESPRHRFFANEFGIANRLVTCGEYLEFINDGGYSNPQYWLSLGWSAVCAEHWKAPLYWREHDGQWTLFTLAGWVPVNRDWPVCHVSFFEAEAFARWRGQRLLTEAEWELACHSQEHDRVSTDAQFMDRAFQSNFAIHPTRSAQGMLGGVWEWTRSSYEPYPGFAPAEGAVGEYNGKFMCNQYVLRGGSVATDSSHIRPTYRNFFPPETRWQFSGIRLAAN